MNVSAWSIRNPIPSVMLFILLTLAGWLSFHSMKVQDFPDVELPTVIVTAALPGGSPGQIETEVARKIENSAATLQGVKNIYTKATDGVATITVEFNLEKPISEAVDDVRNAVNRVRSELPGALKDPVISKLEFSGMPVLAYTIASSKKDEEALSWFVDDQVTKALLAVPGLGSVARVGGVTREVRVALDAAKMAALNVSAAEVSRTLSQVQQEASGGRADLGGAEQAVRTVATVASAQELAAVQIALNDGRRVRLEQIASVVDTVAERRAAALLNGKPVVAFEITRSKGASEIDVGEGTERALATLKATHPDITITQAYNMVEPVREGFYGSMLVLIEGAILAVIVVWFFLRDWRATFVSAAALPLSVIPTYIGMYFLGFSLNTVTLLALALVIGILVDDAIVEIENIMRHLRMGKTPFQAAMEAADEIGLAVIATTFTLVAVFLPTAFMSGVAGKFFKQFGWTAALAIMASLLVARLLTPMMAAYLLKPIAAEKRHQPDGMVMRSYLRLAAWCVNHRWATVLMSALFFIGSLALIPLLPTGFIPPDDRSQSAVKLELPPGATLADTLATAEAARAIIAKNPYVTLIYTAIGSGNAGSDPFAGGGASQVRQANLILTLKERGERPKKQLIETELRNALIDVPGARMTVGLGGSGEKFQLVLTGDDGATLSDTARAVERDLRTIPGVGAVTSGASLIRPEVLVKPDYAKAADAGVTAAAIADTLRIATSGDYDTQIAKLNLAQRQVPIMVKLDDAARRDLESLKRLAVPAKQGYVMLGNVAELSLASGSAQIDRLNRKRNVIIEVELNGQSLGEVDAAAAKLPSLTSLPPGVSRAPFGDAEEMKALFASFGLAMLTGIICIWMVLVLLFKDFTQPFSILAALPLSIGGAFIALLVAGSSFSMPSLIGLIMLMGVATKNSILLIDYVIIARRDLGMARFEALIDACHKRARPIVMTTIAMGAGMLPIALGIGVDPSFRAPMAIAVIGGLITSTLLSLLVIPVVYTIVDDLTRWAGRVVARLRGKAGTVEAAA